jgi:hypothetical protein
MDTMILTRKRLTGAFILGMALALGGTGCASIDDAQDNDELTLEETAKVERFGGIDDPNSNPVIDPVEMNGSSYNTYNDCKSWLCDEYMSGGGFTDERCQKIIGAACVWANIHWAGKVACSAGTIFACYVPKWKVCTRGHWLPVCPF